MSKKILFGIVLLAGLLLWWAIRADSEFIEEEVELVDESPLIETEIREEKKKKTPKLVEVIKFDKAEAVVLSSEEIAKKAYHELALLEAKIRKKGEQCRMELKKILPEDDFIDPEDAIYKDHELVLETTKNVFLRTMYRPETDSAYLLFRDMLQNEVPFDVDQMIDRLDDQFDVCRNSRSLNFIESAIEAASHHKWNERNKQKFFELSLQSLDSTIGIHYSTPNLVYALGIFRMMVENEMLPGSALEDINYLHIKVIDQERLFRQSYKRDGDELQKRQMLRDNFGHQDDLGIELRELIKSLRSHYSDEL